MSFVEIGSAKKLILVGAAVVALCLGLTFDKDNALAGSGNVLHAFALPFENLASGKLVTGQISSGEKYLDPLQAYVEVLDALSADYCGPGGVDPDELTFAAIRGMLATTGDLYTRFLDPDAYQKIREENVGNFVGIGAYLNATKDGEPFIVRPMEGAPAEKAGILAGDIIRIVDGLVVKGMLLDDVVKLIKGKAGTKVTITVERRVEGQEESQSEEITIARARVEHPVVESEMKEDGIGWIWLMSFNATTDSKFANALSELEETGELKGLILDLRSNAGGLFEGALDISSKFLESGTIVHVKERGKAERQYEVKPNERWANKYPLVVLVNGGSASASEIVAGAVQENGAGTLVGEKTFGKGLVQTIYPMGPPDRRTAVTITTAIYLTPNKVDINKKGIIPDVDVEITAEDIQNQRDPQLERAIELLKAQMDGGTALTVN